MYNFLTREKIELLNSFDNFRLLYDYYLKVLINSMLIVFSSNTRKVSGNFLNQMKSSAFLE